MAEAAPAPGATKPGASLRVGDMIGSRTGQPRTITALEPYPRPHLFDFMDERWQILRSGDYSETLCPDHPWRLAVNGVWGISHHVGTNGEWI